MFFVKFVCCSIHGLQETININEAREIGKKGYFVILTTHREFSMKGYVVNAFRYIDKLYMREGIAELFTALHNNTFSFESLESK